MNIPFIVGLPYGLPEGHRWIFTLPPQCHRCRRLHWIGGRQKAPAAHVPERLGGAAVAATSEPWRPPGWTTRIPSGLGDITGGILWLFYMDLYIYIYSIYIYIYGWYFMDPYKSMDYMVCYPFMHLYGIFKWFVSIFMGGFSVFF